MVNNMKRDERGSAKAMKALALVITVSVFSIVAAFTLPVAIDNMAGNSTTTLTQDVDTTVDVNGELESNVTSVTTGSPDTATVELNDTRTSGTTSKTIDNGSTADYSLDGGTVTVGVEDVDTSTSPNQATINYTYSTDYAYSDSASSVWDIIPLAIVLAAFLFLIGVGLRASGRV